MSTEKEKESFDAKAAQKRFTEQETECRKQLRPNASVGEIGRVEQRLNVANDVCYILTGVKLKRNNG